MESPVSHVRRCSKCKKSRDENMFQQVGWAIDRITPRFHPQCYLCRRLYDRKRYQDPEFQRVKKIKRKLHYEATGR